MRLRARLALSLLDNAVVNRQFASDKERSALSWDGAFFLCSVSAIMEE